MKQDEIFAEMRNDPRLRPYIPVNEFYEETLQRIRKDPSLYRHVPIYAEKDFAWAIAQVRSLENSQNLRPGIHYIVLIDLWGSTIASKKLDPETNIERIEEFIRLSVEALGKTQLRNSANFIKEIGDAALFLFSNFTDVLDWADTVDELHGAYNFLRKVEEKPDVYLMFSKKCVHVGEVFLSDRTNPIALAVNQVFKIEKLFFKGQLGITDHVRDIISPQIESGVLSAILIDHTTLPGENNKRPLWSITRPNINVNSG